MATAAEGETTMAEGDPPVSLLLRLLELPAGFFEKEVLQRLGPADLASVAGVGRAYAAAVASAALMRWAKDEKTLLPRPSMFDVVSRPAPLLCLREACSLAAFGGHLKVLKWLLNTGCPRDAWTCVAAARGGHLEVLKWLHITGCPWNTVMCGAAATGGHLEVLKWLHNTGCPWGLGTTGQAARGGHLAVLKWLHHNGCPWDNLTCKFAASEGYLEMLKWLRITGCPWEWFQCRTAAWLSGHTETVDWLDEVDLEWSDVV
jgi:hypothetical protein